MAYRINGQMHILCTIGQFQGFFSDPSIHGTFGQSYVFFSVL